MACSKYTLTNTGSTTVNFSYRRCDDSLWEYQVELLPAQTKNIWTIDGTYTVAPLFGNLISLINQGAFPPVNATATPTATPTVTPTITPTPSITASITPTPSITATQTQTSTSTPTPTNTVTPTEPTRYIQVISCHDENSAAGACNCDQGATIWTNGVDLASSTLAWSDANGANTGDPVGYYVEDGHVFQVGPGCGIGCTTGSTVTRFGPCGPTPTPTNTSTATPTPTNTVTPQVSPTNTATPTNTPTNTSTPTNTPTNTSTTTNTPTNTASGTPPVTPSPTPSSFGTNTFKVVMEDEVRARLLNYTLTESPYIGSSGIGFSATTGSYPLSASTGPAAVYGTHDAIATGTTVSFSISSGGSGGLSVNVLKNGSYVKFFNTTSSFGTNVYNFNLGEQSFLVSDTIHFEIY